MNPGDNCSGSHFFPERKNLKKGRGGKPSNFFPVFIDRVCFYIFTTRTTEYCKTKEMEKLLEGRPDMTSRPLGEEVKDNVKIVYKP